MTSARRLAEQGPDPFAKCPDDARAILDTRLAALDRGEGLTTEQLAERLREWRRPRSDDSGTPAA